MLDRYLSPLARALYAGSLMLLAVALVWPYLHGTGPVAWLNWMQMKHLGFGRPNSQLSLVVLIVPGILACLGFAFALDWIRGAGLFAQQDSDGKQ